MLTAAPEDGPRSCRLRRTMVVKAPTGLGLAAAARKFGEVFLLVWAGSQVTKAFRAAAALVLAPAADALLARVVVSTVGGRPSEKNKAAALAVVAVCCFAFAALLFAAVVVVWS